MLTALSRRSEDLAQVSTHHSRCLVLFLTWEISDMKGCDTEAALLEATLRDGFGYEEFEHFKIPESGDSEAALRCKIGDFTKTLNEIPGSLGIVHYGGHADSAWDQQRISIWASHREGGKTVCWSDIQPILGRTSAEIVLILDCCNAAQAARAPPRIRADHRLPPGAPAQGHRTGSDRSVVISYPNPVPVRRSDVTPRVLAVPKNVSILAAAGAGHTTPLPLGPQSFTLVLIRELQGLLVETQGRGFSMNALHARLTDLPDLKESPVHVVQGDATWLGPLRSDFVESPDSPVQSDVFVRIRSKLSAAELLDQLHRALNRLPPAVSVSMVAFVGGAGEAVGPATRQPATAHPMPSPEKDMEPRGRP